MTGRFVMVNEARGQADRLTYSGSENSMRVAALGPFLDLFASIVRALDRLSRSNPKLAMSMSTRSQVCRCLLISSDCVEPACLILLRRPIKLEDSPLACSLAGMF